MQIGNVMIWCSTCTARRLGASHRARIHGIIPGFFNPETNLWVPRSDLLNPIDDILSFLWAITRQMRGEEPDFMFEIGEEID